MYTVFYWIQTEREKSEINHHVFDRYLQEQQLLGAVAIDIGTALNKKEIYSGCSMQF